MDIQILPSREAYSIDDFCRAYGIGRSKAYAEIKAGALRPVKIGRRTLIAASEAKAWFAGKAAA